MPAPSGSSARPSRRSARSSESSASRSGVRPGATRASSSSGSWRRAPRRAATSRQALSVSRCSHVENAASPRNWPSFTHSFASASWAASRASSGSASTWAASRSTRGACRAQSASSARASPSLARRHEDGVAEPVVGELSARAATRHRFDGASAERVAPGESTGRGRGPRPVAVRAAGSTDLFPAGSRATTTSVRIRADPAEREVARGRASEPAQRAVDPHRHRRGLGDPEARRPDERAGAPAGARRAGTAARRPRCRPRPSPRARPCRSRRASCRPVLAPFQARLCGPAGSDPVNGVATHLPSRSTRRRTVAGAASWKVTRELVRLAVAVRREHGRRGARPTERAGDRDLHLARDAMTPSRRPP